MISKQKMARAAEKLNDVHAKLQEYLDEQQTNFDAKSETYQESEKGLAWRDQLEELATALDNLENAAMDFENLAEGQS